MNRHFVDYNAIPAPYVAMSDTAKTPSQIAAELEEQRKAAQAADAEAYKSMTPPPSATKPREPAYQPEGFDFAYVDRKGHQSEAIPKRPEPAALAAPEPKQAPAAADVPAAPTEWQSGPPPSVGWWTTTEVTARYFDGLLWSLDTYIDRATATQRRNLMQHTALADQWSIRWRGPRLTGEAWPEPQQ